MFAKFWKAVVSFVMSVCLSTWNYWVPNKQIFMKVDSWVFFWKSVKKIQVSLKSHKNNRYFTWRPVYTFNILLKSLYNENCFKKGVEQIKTHLMFNNYFFDSCAVYDALWENIIGPRRPQMLIWHICTACWIPEATNTHSEHVIFIDFPLQQW
jgi:hypothetical protein